MGDDGDQRFSLSDTTGNCQLCKLIVKILRSGTPEVFHICLKNAELQIRGGNEDYSKIVFLISQQNHML